MTAEQFHQEISTVEAAKKYKLTPSYIARLARNQIIRARKFGRDWIVDEQALQDYLAQPRRPGPKPRMMENQVEVQRRSSADPQSEGDRHATAKKYGNGTTLS
jgi:excisionase family DNA binding protein